MSGWIDHQARYAGVPQPDSDVRYWHLADVPRPRAGQMSALGGKADIGDAGAVAGALAGTL